MAYFNARWFLPELGRFGQADTDVPESQGVQAWDRYAGMGNNPVKYIDPDGHVPIIPLLIAAGIIILKAIDYGWTAYDIYQSIRTLNNPDATQAEKDAASATLAMAIAFEAAEPDEALPLSLPLDDIARKVVKGAGQEFVEAVGQKHHVLSNKVMDALGQHKSLKGVFDRNSFLVQALDPASHKGYQEWHRQYDDTIVAWLQSNQNATREQFLTYLLELYRDTDLKERFPDAWLLLQMALHEAN